jgi:hypothetical protein
MIRMNTEIRDRWLAALRSGAYKEGVGCLYNSETGAHCVLGVLCELAVQDGVVQRQDGSDGDDSIYNGHSITLPQEVVEWAGVDHHNPLVQYFDEEEGTVWEAIAEVNDRGIPFSVIADMIEETFSGPAITT